jgi:hypothetical protein
MICDEHSRGSDRFFCPVNKSVQIKSLRPEPASASTTNCSPALVERPATTTLADEATAQVKQLSTICPTEV